MAYKDSMAELHENITTLSGIITGFNIPESLKNITSDLPAICQSKKEMDKAITSIDEMITTNDEKIKLFKDTLESMEIALDKLSAPPVGGSSRRKKRGLKSKKRRSGRRKIKGGGRRSRRNRTRKNIR